MSSPARLPVQRRKQPSSSIVNTVHNSKMTSAIHQASGTNVSDNDTTEEGRLTNNKIESAQADIGTDTSKHDDAQEDGLEGLVKQPTSERKRNVHGKFTPSKPVSVPHKVNAARKRGRPSKTAPAQQHPIASARSFTKSIADETGHKGRQSHKAHVFYEVRPLLMTVKLMRSTLKQYLSDHRQPLKAEVPNIEITLTTVWKPIKKWGSVLKMKNL